MSEPTETPQLCSRCRQPLPVGCLAGHCSRCLVETAFGEDFADENHHETVDQFPRAFGDYELLGILGCGGMGVVYRARQIALDREVALKMLPGGEFARPDARQRFRRECLATARLQHPHIVPIYQVGEAEGVAFFTMELVDGHTLATSVAEGPLPATTAAHYLRAVAEAVHFAHQKGILHRDLKPSNILLDAFDQPRLTDFGLARPFVSEAELTRSRQVVGSPAYMSPEQASDRDEALEPRSDVYGLGSVLYHALTGRPPFQADTIHEVLLQVQNVEPIPPRRLNPSVPLDLETICLKCLEKNPARRYATAGELADELGRFLRHEPILARPIGRLGKLQRWCGRNRAMSAALLALLVTFGAGLTGVFWEWHRATQSDQVTRQNLYAADIKAASLAIEHGDLGLARHLLEAYLPTGKRTALARLATGRATARSSKAPPSSATDVRGFEWRYLWSQCQGQQLATLEGHTWIVTCVAFAPDGRLLASGGQDGTIRLWSPETHQLLRTLTAHQGAVWSVGFAPEGDLFVTSGSDHEVKVWTAESPRLVATFVGQMAALSPHGPFLAIADASLLFWEPAGRISIWDYRANRKLRELPESGRYLTFSADGQTLAVTDPAKGLRLWNVTSGECLKTLATDGPVWSPSFSPSGHQILASSRDKSFVWNLNDATKPAILEHPLHIWAARFSPDGKHILTASSDRGIRLWDAATLTLNAILWGHTDEIWCAAYSPNGKLIATGGKDQTIKLWTDEPVLKAELLPHTAFARPFFTSDGKRLVTIVNTETQPRSVLWNVAQHTQIGVMQGYAAGFSSDGKYLVRLASDGRALEWWSPDTQKLEKTIPLAPASGVALLPPLAFSSDWSAVGGEQADGTLAVFDARTGKSLGTAPWGVARLPSGAVPKIRALTLSRNGRLVAASTETEKLVRLYDLTLAREAILEGHRDFVSGLAFSPDDRLLASGSVDGKIKLWNPATGREQATLAGHVEEATDVVFAPDGLTLASIGAQTSVKFWHVATGRELLSLDFPHAGFHLQFSPDGSRLAITVGTTANAGVQILHAPPASL